MVLFTMDKCFLFLLPTSDSGLSGYPAVILNYKDLLKKTILHLATDYDLKHRSHSHHKNLFRIKNATTVAIIVFVLYSAKYIILLMPEQMVAKILSTFNLEVTESWKCMKKLLPSKYLNPGLPVCIPPHDFRGNTVILYFKTTQYGIYYFLA